jgi:hypothetical protein
MRPGEFIAKGRACARRLRAKANFKHDLVASVPNLVPDDPDRLLPVDRAAGMGDDDILARLFASNQSRAARVNAGAEVAAGPRGRS